MVGKLLLRVGEPARILEAALGRLDPVAAELGLLAAGPRPLAFGRGEGQSHSHWIREAQWIRSRSRTFGRLCLPKVETGTGAITFQFNFDSISNAIKSSP